jgi:hypothetical protein
MKFTESQLEAAIAERGYLAIFALPKLERKVASAGGVKGGVIGRVMGGVIGSVPTQPFCFTFSPLSICPVFFKNNWTFCNLW